jgi:hypothetical protein
MAKGRLPTASAGHGLLPWTIQVGRIKVAQLFAGAAQTQSMGEASVFG